MHSQGVSYDTFRIEHQQRIRRAELASIAPLSVVRDARRQRPTNPPRGWGIRRLAAGALMSIGLCVAAAVPVASLVAVLGGVDI